MSAAGRRASGEVGMRSAFGACHEQALSGELDAWAATPRGRLALILLLDQFTRNLARNTAGAYAGDARAQQLTLDGLVEGADAELSFEELLFFLLPLGHSEALALHERNLTLLERATAAAPAAMREAYQSAVQHARGYRAQIQHFGRFPHRNAVLGRTCTQEEMAFLASPSARG